MRISFINSVANICEAVDANISEVAKGIGMDQRIGPQFLAAGLGYGGSCFHKDVKAFRCIGNKTGVDLGLPHEIERVNDAQRLLFFNKVSSALNGLHGKKLGVLGLAFKGGTDDIRESPAIHLVRSFVEGGCSVVAYDPAATKNAQRALSGECLTFVDDPYHTMDMADALVILTDWAEFSQLDLMEVKQRMRTPVVLDGRNLFDDKEMRDLGFTYIGVGMPAKPTLENKGPSFTSKAKSRVLVTGAAGFLGSHLVDALIAEGHSVLGVDNFLTGKQNNLEHLRTEQYFELLEHDITNPFDSGRVDMVFNMASPASPIDYTVHGVETLLVGSLGTHNVLEIARKYKASFLHCSTSECYGDPLVHPQPESYWGHVNPIGPRSVYDESKRFSEALIMAFHRYHGLDTRLVRIFNTYGPRLQLNDGRVISNFLRQALCEEDLTVYGDGSQTRSFCYVSDQIEGLLRLILRRNLSRQYRQPGRVHNPGMCQTGARSYWSKKQNRISSAAAGRPKAALPGHNKGEGTSGVAAKSQSGKRSATFHSMVQGEYPFRVPDSQREAIAAGGGSNWNTGASYSILITRSRLLIA